MAFSYLDEVRASSRLEGASRSTKAIRWLTGLVVIGHGLIHGLGPLDIWGIADIQGFSGDAALAVSETSLQIVAMAWLVAMVTFVTVGFGIIAARAWWQPWALVGAIVSQLVIAIWWADAAAGTIPNLLIAAAAIWGEEIYPPFNSEHL